MANRRKNRKRKPKNYSRIQEHKRQGKKLIPNWKQIPNLKPVSWLNDRLPNLLWATLLVTHLPRNHALNVFRQIFNYIHSLREDDKFGDITHTGLSMLPPEQFSEVLSIIIGREEQRQCLYPLLLLDALPRRNAWDKVLGVDRVVEDWTPLMLAVGHTLWHQSQQSTDCRWVRLGCAMIGYKIKMPPEKIEGILNYPNLGDLREIRPSIRALEINVDTFEQDESNADRLAWAGKFWDECLIKTPCNTFYTDNTEDDMLAGTSVERVKETYNFLIAHTNETRKTSGIDNRHEAVFGLGFFCLSLLQELLRVGSCNSIGARTILRTIAECYITLAYLAKKDNAELWQSYRVYGAGQAKLAFLKLDASVDSASYVDVDSLKYLANEDIWQEFLDIDLGHWDKSNLREMSKNANVKDVYDQFYDWPSAFAHGNWGAIRDSVFDTCSNPLHRLHRIPRPSSRALPDVIPDACQLVDKVLQVLSHLYPSFPHKVTLKI